MLIIRAMLRPSDPSASALVSYKTILDWFCIFPPRKMDYYQFHESLIHIKNIKWHRRQFIVNLKKKTFILYTSDFFVKCIKLHAPRCFFSILIFHRVHQFSSPGNLIPRFWQKWTRVMFLQFYNTLTDNMYGHHRVTSMAIYKVANPFKFSP